MILLLIIIIGLSGVFITFVLNRLKLINYSKINLLEYFSMTLFTGLLFFVMYILGLSFIKIDLDRFMFLPIYIIDFISIFILILQFKKKEFLKLKFTKIDLIPIFLFILLFIIYFFEAFSSNLKYPDEFAVWALNAKNIFIGKSLEFNVNTGLENYPPLLPVLYSSYYIFVNEITENVIKTIPVIITFIGIIGIVGITNKKNISISKSLLSIIFIFLSYESLNVFMTCTYGDLPFSIFYTLGTIYFIEMLFSKDFKTNAFLSIIYYNACCLTKQDCIYMLSLNYFILILIYLFKNKLNDVNKLSLKKCIILFCLFAFSYLVWFIYTKVVNYPKLPVLGAESGIGFKYLSLLIENMNNQMFGCVTFSIFFVICVILMFNTLSFNNKKSKINSLYTLSILAFVVFVPVFMFVCYMIMFGAEAETAASYIRYLTRIIFILDYLLLILFKFNQEKEKCNLIV